MKIGDLVKVKGDSRSDYGLGIVLRVKKECSRAYESRILEVFIQEGTYTLAERMLEVIRENR
jgi:hypothetical protein